MYDKASLLFIYTETPVHAGSGTSLGVVDLPIQRERYTDLPMIQSSGIKGKLRAEADATNQEKQKVEVVFGPEKEASEHAGALSVGDARLLLFPVRSLAGLFAWVTSPYVLNRFLRDAKMANQKLPWTVPSLADDADSAFVTSGSKLIANTKIVLEEFAFTANTSREAEVKAIAKWLAENAFPQGNEYDYWRKKLRDDGGLAILPEDAFRDFTRFSTQVISRIKIDPEKKTVAHGALWTEEHLPADTLMYAPLFASKPRVNAYISQGKKEFKELLSDNGQSGSKTSVP